MDVSKHVGRKGTCKEHFRAGTNCSQLLIECGKKGRGYKYDNLTFFELLLCAG